MSYQNTNSDAHSDVKLTPVSCLVLGLIGLRGPSSPYDLKRAISRSVSYFWPFPHSQLYDEPERLVEAGLLSRKAETSGRRSAQVISAIGIIPVPLDLFRWNGNVLSVLSAFCVDVAVDVLDFGRIAVRVVATTSGRIVRHVPR